jgi:hypothetical protein
MKAPLNFDPADYEYGPATAGVRHILNELQAVDWFAPSSVTPPDRELAVKLFIEHNQRARAHQPALFQNEIEVQTVISDGSEFVSLCERIRTSATWDWKFSALKKLSRDHSKALGWALKEQASLLHRDPDEPPKPGDLFMSIGEHAVWKVAPQRQLDSRLPEDLAKAIQWYWGYAEMDFIECLEWQLAEKSGDLDLNPFVPLVRCYTAGFYPFSFSPSSSVLFAFSDKPLVGRSRVQQWGSRLSAILRRMVS